MSKDRKFDLTQEEGHSLFVTAALFGLPEKIGEKEYTIADRGIASDEVRALYRELRSRSPLFQGRKRAVLFGPGDSWKKKEMKKDGVQDWDLEKPETIVPVKLSEDAHAGTYWCLLMVLHPESRTYAHPPMETTEAAIRPRPSGDLYVVIGDPTGDGGWSTRIYHKPMIHWIWGGAMVMVLGGIISLSDRRHRVGAPAGRRRKRTAAEKVVEAGS